MPPSQLPASLKTTAVRLISDEKRAFTYFRFLPPSISSMFNIDYCCIIVNIGNSLLRINKNKKLFFLTCVCVGIDLKVLFILLVLILLPLLIKRHGY